jgi:geranylgeranyl transferase type-2 subunit alpha
MHGRKRAEYKARFQNPKVLEVLSQKSLQWHRLMEELLQRRQQFLNYGDNSDTNDNNTKASDFKLITLELLEKALVVNPDPYWLWQFRRELLQSWDTRMSETNWEKEASLTQSALLSNPKAYAAWHHRKWCIVINKNSDKPEEDHPQSLSLLSSELALTAEFLKADERNFHCWSYRKFIVRCLLHNDPKYQDIYGEQLANEQPSRTDLLGSNEHEESQRKVLQNEWDFTSTKIADNFSNFSAWHYRSQLLQHRCSEETNMDWKEELTLIENGICTEPDDQSIWWYHGIVLETMDDATRESLLPQHMELLQELLEETNRSCKWVFFGLLKCNAYLIPNDKNTALTNGNIYHELIRIDPDRRQRYECCLRKLGMSIGAEEPHA